MPVVLVVDVAEVRSLGSSMSTPRVRVTMSPISVLLLFTGIESIGFFDGDISRLLLLLVLPAFGLFVTEFDWFMARVKADRMVLFVEDEDEEADEADRSFV